MTIRIPRGVGVREIQELLEQAGLIRKDIRFLLLCRLTGAGRRLQAGEFRFPYRSTPLEILHILEQGRVVQHRVTIPEGLTMYQTARIFSRDGWADADHFLALCRDREFIRSLGLHQDSLEGYLFPDTYLLARDRMDDAALVRMMVERFLAIWRELAPAAQEETQRHRVVILASIVEKETGSPEERPRIARVFLNRLEKNMPLQADPTVIYGLETFDGNLTRADLQRKTPYNTYVIRGLPAGPICSPGRAALQAVLHPAEGQELYFVSRNDGTHHFSTTLQEHNRAVRRFQKNRQPLRTRPAPPPAAPPSSAPGS